MTLSLFTPEPHTPTIPGLTLVPEFIDRTHEHALLATIEALPWLDDIRRQVQQYGYKYNYRSSSIDHSAHLGPLPDWALEIAQRMQTQKLIDTLPNQAIINAYRPGEGIGKHIDGPQFGETIISLSLGAMCVMDFTYNPDRSRKHAVLLHPRTLLIMRGEARHDWLHAIAKRQKDVWHGETIPRARRISITFRTVLSNT